MRHCDFATLSFAALLVAAATTSAPAQGQRPNQAPPSGGQMQRAPQQMPPAPPPQAAPKPYNPVAISAPPPVNDPSFAAFRQQLTAVAQKKDRAGLGRLIVAQGFFWMGESGDKADKKKSGLDNFTKALDLGNKDGSGWEVLVGYASDPTGSPMPERKNVVCAPADPVFDEKAFEDLVKSSGTSDWGYPTQPGLEVRGGPQPNAPVIEKIGLHFVRVMQDENAAPPDPQNPTMRIVTPSGKVGYVPIDAINPLGNDQICYAKDASGWKITGFIGGEQ